ncbi:CPK16 [Symbiodinium natans]|uniref:CPK16 protein n=1 Tax=Symbiodinium natans TaxID=878477 RepID=A0A812UPR5_9DINO|nr:CPK16 [Symbiodinium natans]
MGSTISIPAPKFLTQLRNLRGQVTSGAYEGRLEGDLVLQNGEGIFTLQLGFPFRSTLTISAAGWTRAQISWKGDEIVATNYVEVGIKLPKVPGLSNIMEFFVKSYGTQSTQDCTDALARAAEVARPPETPLQIVEEKVKEFFTPLTEPEAEETEAAEREPQTDEDDIPVEAELAQPLQTEAEPAPPEEQPPSYEELPPPVAPGMEEANLVVTVKIDPKKRRVEGLGAEGAANLMAGSDRQILEAMAQEGWEVEVVDESRNLYMLSLPPVLYEVMGSTISIPAPRFLTTLRNTSGRDGGKGSYKDRIEGDLVLQNGENIFTLQLGFPFRSTLTISAAGWTRATVGWDGDKILSSNYVEVGIKLPKVPGLTNIMEYFVKSYGTQSTQDCTDALARAAADARPPESPLQSIEEKMKELLNPLTDGNEDAEDALMASGPGRPSSR